AFLNSVDAMANRCKTESVHDNPGAFMGATMGGLTLAGVDKLTLVTSPALESFGLWTEQMIAESLGKDGKGVVPVAGEPLLAPDTSGNDRFFVYLRLEGNDNATTDKHVEAMRQAGKPVVQLDMAQRNDLG